MTWFSSTAWSVMADLWVTLLSLALEARVCVPAVKESTSFLCSLILRLNFLPVSPTYELEQFLQGTRQINSVFSSSLTLSFGWTTKLCSVQWGRLAVVMPWDFRILANASLSPFTYSTTTIPFVCLLCSLLSLLHLSKISPRCPVWPYRWSRERSHTYWAL